MEAGAAAEFGDSRDKFMYFRNAGNEVRQFDQEEDPNGTYVVGIDRRYSESQNGKDEFSYDSGTPRRIVGDKSLVGPSLSNQDGQQRRQSGLSDASDGTEILTPTLGRDQDSSGNADGDDYIGRDRRSTGEYRGGRQWQRPSEIEADFDQDMGPDVRAAGRSKGGRQWQRQSDIESDFGGPDVQAAGRSKGGRQWQRQSDIESDFDQDRGPDVQAAGVYKSGRQWQRPSDLESDFDQDTGPDVQTAGEYKGGRQWRRQSDIESDFDQDTGPDMQAAGEYKGRREWQRRSDIESDFDQDIGPDVRPTGESEMRPASPSYPPEAYQNYRNLPMLNSKKPDDEQFQKLLDIVDTLLNEGREGLEGRIEVGVAERMLYEAADICAKALTIRPSSLQAIGLWGNTLLLHGELKLRLSQNLRSMVPEPLSQALRRRNSWEAEQEQEGLEQTLQEVCEECEELLVEAGRKFRLALSLDRTDMRALYNWGLALCHRAQLISEEGGERSAQDADRVYLAAIDKFEAMMGMSQKYAPGALLNWGLAIRDRSRLRPLGSKERMKLLAQAKEVFKEALQFDPNYGPARGAVVACTIELKELEEFVDEPIEPPTRERPRDRPPRQQQRGWVERQDVENESQPRSWWG